MDTLPPYVFFDFLFPKLKEEDKRTLSICSKSLYQIHGTANKTYVAGNYKLKPIQGYICDQMEKPNQHIIFRAPFSYGKTATGLAVAFRNWYPGKVRGPDEHPWLIFAPANVVDVWMKEALAMYGGGIYISKTLESPLVAINKSDIHRTLTEENISPLTHAILLSTNTRTNYFWMFSFCHMILDEAHKNHHCKSSLRRDRSALFLSATAMKEDFPILVNGQEESLHFRTISVPISCVIEKVPTPVFHIVNTPGNELELSAAGEKGADPIYIEYALALLIRLPRRVAVFSPGNLLPDLITRVEGYFGLTRPIFKFIKSTKVIAKAAQSPNSILLIGHSASEGINVVCEDVIVIRGDWLNKERINQLLGRCLRTINPNKTVNYYHLVPHGLPHLLLLYTDACLSHRISLNQKTADVDLLTSGFRLMMLLDPGLEKTTPADIIAIVNMNRLPAKEMLEWWRSKKSGYNRELQDKLIKLPFFS